VVDVPAVKRALAALARDDGANSGSEGERNARSDVSVSGATGRPSERAPHAEMTVHRDVVDSAAAAVTAVDEAAAFVETIGLDRLRRAVESVPDRETRRRGQRALAAFERFRRVAAADRGETRYKHRFTDGEQFHRGRGTDLRGARQREDT
jgi:hypothetical protein